MVPPLPPVPAIGPQEVSPYAVTLAWDYTEAHRPYLRGFRLYQGTNSGSYRSFYDVFDPGATSAVVYVLDRTLTNFFVCTAVDTNADESDPSNEAMLGPEPPPTNRWIRVWAEKGPSVNGPWTNVAAWPVLVLTNATGQEFYRLRIE